MHIWASL